MTDPVRRQYEALPYPPRKPQDETKRLVTGSPSRLAELNHFVFGGRRDWSKPFRALFCPDDRIGPVDAYLVTHHGNADAADRASFAALRPRAAIVNNGATKGGAPGLLAVFTMIGVTALISTALATRLSPCRPM